jgi:hypothetical protein
MNKPATLEGADHTPRSREDDQFVRTRTMLRADGNPVKPAEWRKSAFAA